MPSARSADWFSCPETMSQRDKIRQLFRLYNQDEPETVAAYAEAEQRGDVIRKRDSQGLTSAQYANRLCWDGTKKGWIRQ